MRTTCASLAGWGIFWRWREWERETVSAHRKTGDTRLNERHSSGGRPRLRVYLGPFPGTAPWSPAGSCVRSEASSRPQWPCSCPRSASPQAAAPGPTSGLHGDGGGTLPQCSVDQNRLPIRPRASRPYEPYIWKDPCPNCHLSFLFERQKCVLIWNTVHKVVIYGKCLLQSKVQYKVNEKNVLILITSSALFWRTIHKTLNCNVMRLLSRSCWLKPSQWKIFVEVYR